jgi:hypothetical protein
MHDLEGERFYAGHPRGRDQDLPAPRHQRFAAVSPHGRLLPLEDVVEFFDIVLAAHLTAAEKQDLVAYLRAL